MDDNSGTAEVAFAPGVHVGRYTLLRRLAAGGMAELFLARAEGIHGFEKLCVVKRVLPHLAADRSFVEMFLQEARIAATLDHPNLVHVNDIGEHEGNPYFVMEYVHGRDVHSLIHRSARQRRLPLGAALQICTGVAAGLHYVHERRDPSGRSLGLVHRDVSPSNVLVTYDGGVKLVDFGIVKATHRRGITRTGVLKGKAAYMAPEQCTGKALDRRTDVFALGILLFETTTGHMLFDGGSDFEIMTKIVHEDAISPTAVVPDYPEELAAIVHKALRRRPDDRFETARDVQVALEGFVREHRIRASQVELENAMIELFGSQPYPTELLDVETPGADQTTAARWAVPLPDGPQALATTPMEAASSWPSTGENEGNAGTSHLVTPVDGRIAPPTTGEGLRPDIAADMPTRLGVYSQPIVVDDEDRPPRRPGLALVAALGAVALAGGVAIGIANGRADRASTESSAADRATTVIEAAEVPPAEPAGRVPSDRLEGAAPGDPAEGELPPDGDAERDDAPTNAAKDDDADEPRAGKRPRRRPHRAPSDRDEAKSTPLDSMYPTKG